MSNLIKTITIVTPSYNQGQFIEQTIKSVLSQAGNFYIDYIIADGGSTDQSVSIIKKYNELIKNNQYPIKCLGIKFTWWTKPDAGQANAINNGFQIASGSILAWLNSDDYYEPGAIEYIVNKLRNNPDVDMVYGHCFSLQEETSTKKNLIIKETNFNNFLRRGDSICQPAAFFTKKIYDQVGGLLNENLNYVIDYDLFLKIFQTGQTLHVNKTLANFRLWENSKTCSQQTKLDKERKKLLKSYGGNFIDPKTIYRFRYKIPFTDFTRKYLPFIYKPIKNIFYLIADNIHHSNKWKN